MSRSAEEATDIGNCRIDRGKKVHFKTKAKKPKQNYLSFENSILNGTYLKMATKSICYEHDAQWLIFVFFSCEKEKLALL